MNRVELKEGPNLAQIENTFKNRKNEVFVAGNGEPIVEENYAPAISKFVSFFISPMDLTLDIAALHSFKDQLFPELEPVKYSPAEINLRGMDFGYLRFEDPDEERRVMIEIGIYPHPDLAKMARMVSLPNSPWYYSEFLGHIKEYMTTYQLDTFIKIVAKIDRYNLAHLFGDKDLNRYASQMAIQAQEKKLDSLKDEVKHLEWEIDHNKRFPGY